MNSSITKILEHYSVEDLKHLKLLITEFENKKIESYSSSLSLLKFKTEYENYIKSNFSLSYLRSINISFEHLMKYCGEDKRITDITVREAEGFKLFLMQSAAKGYKVYIRNLKAAFNKAVEWEFITANPFQKIKISQSQQSKPVYLNRLDFILMLKHTNSEVLKKLFTFGFYTGCRLGEIVNLKWKHINFPKKIATIGDDDLQTKNKRTRMIPICDTLYYELEWNRSNDDTNQYVFTKTNGFQYNRDYVSRAFKKTVRKGGLSEKIHFHTLRHSFATNLALKGVPLIVIKELLGHSSIVTTQIYSHTVMNALRDAVSIFDSDDCTIN
jgi:integrase